MTGKNPTPRISQRTSPEPLDAGQPLSPSRSEDGQARVLDFSIILPAWNKGVYLRNALDSLVELDFPPNGFEVLVPGSDGDRDSQEIVRGFSDKASFAVSFVPCPISTRGVLLNYACRAAKGEVLVFSDDDCTFPADWLRTIRNIVDREPDLGIVGGRDVFIPGPTVLPIALDFVLTSFVGTGGVRRGRGPSTGTFYPKLWNMAVARRCAFDVAYRDAGGEPKVFDEETEVYVDVDLGRRIEHSGKRLVYAEELHVGHNRATTYGRFIRREIDRARSSRIMGIHRLPHFILSAFVLGWAVLLVGSFFSVPVTWALWIALVLYGLALLVTAFHGLLNTRSIWVFGLIPLLLATLHFFRGIGYLLPLKKPPPMGREI